ncbi:MAG: metallophosphoesterase [Ignavibacteriaceae bacterium]|nr:metallophosphoesterase [Ignavibacteriaceae bacterium]
MAWFFVIFLSLYSLLNYYIGLRVWQALEGAAYLRPIFLIIFLFSTLSYIFSKVVQRYLPTIIYEAIEIIGSFWFAFMLYFFLAIVLLDLIRLLNWGFNILPHFDNYPLVKLITLGVVTGIVCIIIIGGYINTRTLKITTLNLEIPARSSHLKELNAVLISDIHLSSINGNGFAGDIVQKINELHPDIVFVAGDLVDDKASVLREKEIGFAFRDIKSLMGVYGITGNHEYINGVDSAVNYMKELKVVPLRDTSITINNEFVVIGREDRSRGLKKRKSLKELVEGADKNLPIILMDHTPFQLEEAMENGIDLQLSGHTHHGQMFPINLITDRIYELSQGYKKKGNTNYYVSSGVGTWGPPVRTGSRSEIVNLKIKFTN